MKMRHTLTALVATAAFALTACGNDSAPTAAIPTGAGVSSAAATAADGASDTTETAGTHSGDSTGPAAGGACAGLVTLTNDFTETILTKAATGGVTQADVDAVFSDATVSSIPADLKSDVDKLKELSQQLVGKSATDSVSTLQEISTVYQGLAGKVTGGSCS